MSDVEPEEPEVPEAEPEPEVPEVDGDEDEGGLGRAGKIIIANAAINAVGDKNDQPPPQEPVYYPEQHVVTQPPPPGYPQPPQQGYPQPPQQGYPQPGVVYNQPVAYPQGAWIRPDLCGLCCDGTCCYAACCAPCARGEQAQLMGGSYCAAFLIRSCFFCFSVCVLSSERNQIRLRYNIPATDGCCTVLWCEPCVLAQHLYQLRGVRPPF